ncbi:MAG: tRNA lysidine(34) synthetase TilS [Erysipelotrichaceae bacterium]|nr:tRNA lysidine(34) synthetase TilS [Erysipelotrichaceae bacterium]
MSAVIVMQIQLDASRTYVIGVSGGPDSMALLSLCIKQQIPVVVAHVNYHKRESANRDEQLVMEYCNRHQVMVEVLEPELPHKGNFQMLARKARYEFYRSLCEKYQAQDILLAHHQDDVLETYLMQKERGSFVSYYGIPCQRNWNGLRILRPLLEYTKAELLQYVIEQHVPYGIDESNLEDHYRRNQIRHQLVEVASEDQRRQWIKEIEKRNQEQECYLQKLDAFMLNIEDLQQYQKESQKMRIDGLRRYLEIHNIEGAYHYRDAYLVELDRLFLSGKNHLIPLEGEVVLDMSYGHLSVHCLVEEYEYVLDSLKEFQTTVFQVSLQEGPSTCAVFVKGEDFPLTIRCAKEGDSIQMRFGNKKVSRWFIDRKIPLWQRLRWPIVENCQKEIILVPQIGCNVTHYNSKANMFVIK